MKEDTWVDKIKHFYWEHWPYDWRPGQMWYHFKCFAWHRYSTIRPRYLDHSWHDRRCLMPEMMFEILSQFLEQECSPGHVEWYGDYPHIVQVGDVKKNVMDEMKDLYHWWHTVWQKERPEVDEILWAEVEKHPSTSLFTPIEGTNLSKFDRQFETEEDEAINHTCMMALNKLDDIMDAELNKRLHRLINVIPYMWT